MFTEELIKLNEELAPLHLPVDGVLAFGTMFIMVYYDFKPIHIIITGAIIHGVVHPMIAIPK
jgi:hypothetical protein